MTIPKTEVREEKQRNLASDLKQQETQVRDAYGKRWIKCEFCGKIAMESEFVSYGGAIGVHLNLGTCRECAANNPAAKPSFPDLFGNGSEFKVI